MPAPTFENGGIPLSAEGIQGEIARVRRESDDWLHRKMQRKQAVFDAFALGACADLREAGEPVPDDLLEAEADAISRMNDVAVIELCRSIRGTAGRLPEAHRERFRAALARRSLVVDEGEG
ncbi:hypothetical protein [Parahaliea mediterranea]|uniref:hypothetical protein n=1 Tax=Parahaliea mediterranea TaxID=651086 RepID=UPI0013003EC0|nr:hypothetical protein [Parahaliea mediterranea]